MGAMLLSDLISKHPLGVSKIFLAAPVITNPKTVQHVFVSMAFLSALFKPPLPALSQRGGRTA